MTIKDDADMVGRTALLAIGGMRVGVFVTDVKRAYGRVRYVVVPMAGLEIPATVENTRLVFTDDVYTLPQGVI